MVLLVGNGKKRKKTVRGIRGSSGLGPVRMYTPINFKLKAVGEPSRVLVGLLHIQGDDWWVQRLWSHEPKYIAAIIFSNSIIYVMKSTS